jgi:hypothetical protein
MALALLVAQAINFGLIFNERSAPPATRSRARRSPASSPSPSASPLCRRRGAKASSAADEAPRPLLDRRAEHRRPQDNDEGIAARLRDQAADTGLAIRDARGAVSDEVPLPPRAASGSIPSSASAPRTASPLPDGRLSIQLPTALAQRLDGDAAARSLAGGAPRRLATLLIYVLLLGAIVLDRAPARPAARTSPPPPRASRAAAGASR